MKFWMTDAVFSLNTYSKNSPVKYFTFSFIFVIYLFLLQMPFMWILLLYALLLLLISLITLQYCRYIHKGIVKNIIPFINNVNVFFFIFFFFFIHWCIGASLYWIWWAFLFILVAFFPQFPTSSECLFCVPQEARNS